MSPDLYTLVPQVVYEDEYLVVVNKPAGMLSVAGKKQAYCVQSWLQQQYPQHSDILLLHRLDMATSGLLLAAKNRNCHKQLQQQFMQRLVKKRYVAELSRSLGIKQKTIDLPLRVDLNNRPHQIVCYEHGKKALTHMEVISTSHQSSRVYFYPVTGRTHQLRVHAAHHDGLSAPIIGDKLYGSPSDRLYLHAEFLAFTHPVTGQDVEIIQPASF